MTMTLRELGLWLLLLCASGCVIFVFGMALKALTG